MSKTPHLQLLTVQALVFIMIIADADINVHKKQKEAFR